MTETSECPCVSCAYNKLIFEEGRFCPNVRYFFEAFTSAYIGMLKFDPCKDWKGKNE